MGIQNQRTFSVVGLGKLGSPMVACFASAGFNVIGVDVDPEKVSAINAGKAPVFEPNLPEMLAENADHISATTDYAAAVKASEATFIIVPTPSNPDGSFSLRYTIPACKEIGYALREKDDFHLVVMTSTVMPGATQSEIREALERTSGKQCGIDFGLCYSPEFIALGSVIRNFLNPDFVLVGESDKRSGDMIEAIYKQTCHNDPHIARMNFVNAELTKISVNTYVTTKITYANMIAHICENLEGADVDVVSEALGRDTRIGRKYLTGAVGYGGPCFPRDNIALSKLARDLGTPAIVAEAVDASNKAEWKRLADLVKSKLPSGGSVGILGLSYKPDTDVVEESQAIYVARTLLQDGISVTAYDPAAMSNAARAINGPMDLAKSMEDCVRKSDVILITTPWDDFKSLTPEHVDRPDNKRVIIDCWRMLDKNSFVEVCDYVGIGIGIATRVQERIPVTT